MTWWERALLIGLVLFVLVHYWRSLPRKKRRYARDWWQRYMDGPPRFAGRSQQMASRTVEPPTNTSAPPPSARRISPTEVDATMALAAALSKLADAIDRHGRR